MISVLCPTRKRPESLARMIKSARDTAIDPIEFCCYVDDDDPESAAVANDLGASIWVGPRTVLSSCWNECFAISRGNILLQGNDDVVFKTLGWDRTVEWEFSKFGDGILMVHGNDGSGFTKDFGPHPFISRKWVETLGYFTCPLFSSDYGDTWINDLANALGRRRELPFTIEHMHYTFGKTELDQTTIDRLRRHQADNVDRFYRATAVLRDLDVAKLRRYIAGSSPIKPKWAILVLSQLSRTGFLNRILNILRKQIEPYPDVEVRLRIFDKSMDLGANRQAMIDECGAEYVNFVDDDDLVSGNYVKTIYSLLDGVDYVGFQLQCYMDGVPQKPTFHSIQYKEWSEDEAGFYRGISHINPMRRELVKQVSLEGGFGEDHRWADKVRDLGIVKTEHYVPEVLYSYYYRSQKGDVAW